MDLLLISDCAIRVIDVWRAPEKQRSPSERMRGSVAASTLMLLRDVPIYDLLPVQLSVGDHRTNKETEPQRNNGAEALFHRKLRK
jgi:hypothetical protein